MQISVIIPTYKPQEYLFECLESLQRQTLQIDTWEILLILNGCKEPWLSLIKRYLENMNIPNIRLLHTDIPGVSNARNIGIEAAIGEFIAFIDDDDYVSPSYLEELLKLASADTIALSYTEAFQEKKHHIPYYIEQEYKRRAPSKKQPFFYAKRYFGGPCMKLIHRDIIGKQRFDIHFSNGEDSLFMFAISNKVKYVDFTSENAVYHRRLRQGSASVSEKYNNVLQNRLRLMKAYNLIFWAHPKEYNFYFFCTRLLASIHRLLTF